MYANPNMPPVLGANVPPNMAPNVAPMPTYTAPAFDYGCGYGYGYAAPAYRNDFVLIVVLFILLIIVGACVSNFSHC